MVGVGYGLWVMGDGCGDGTGHQPQSPSNHPFA